MKYLAEIDVMPLKEILDPQGKVVSKSMKNLGLSAISNVRIGKHITLEIEATDETEARERVDTACKKLLANLVIESYEFRIMEPEI